MLQFVAHYSSLVLMRRPATIALVLSAACCACSACCCARAQQLIGYVSTHDAEVTGASDVVEGHAVLAGQATVTAKDHTAPISLGRGGTVRVCQTSVLRVTESLAMKVAAPLLFSLDRGAIEVRMNATTNDAVMTPDLLFTLRSGGPLDLRLRVAGDGDTCVENRGAEAPTLSVGDPFGEATYQLQPGQHVLFEHGSVREVVDHESSPCGCPDAEGMSVADALVAPGAGGKAAPAAQAAAEHPFPAAISEGLAPAAEAPPAPAGGPQVSDALTYNAASGDQAGGPGSTQAVQQPGGAAAVQTSAAAAAAPAAAHRPGHRNPVRAVGRFFRRVFGGG